MKLVLDLTAQLKKTSAPAPYDSIYSPSPDGKAPQPRQADSWTYHPPPKLD